MFSLLDLVLRFFYLRRISFSLCFLVMLRCHLPFQIQAFTSGLLLSAGFFLAFKCLHFTLQLLVIFRFLPIDLFKFSFVGKIALLCRDWVVRWADLGIKRDRCGIAGAGLIAENDCMRGVIGQAFVDGK